MKEQRTTGTVAGPLYPKLSMCFEGTWLTQLLQVSGPLYPKLSTCFEGAQLTQLVQLVTAGRLFPCHKGRVDP